MATPNVGILTNAGKKLIDRVNAGQTKIAFSKIVFSSMSNNQLTDDQIKALTTVTPQEIVVNNPEVTLDNNTGETRIRATGNNKALNDGVYVKTYAVYAKDSSSNEILYGITVSPNPNYLPEYDGVTPQAVTYSYKVNISNTSNITFTNSNDVYVSDTDLDEALQPYAKTVDVNQQLDKKVNISDMRKPASDVAGIDEVSALQTQVNNSAVGTNLLIGTSPLEKSYTGDFSTIPNWSFISGQRPAVSAGSTYTYSIYLTKLTGSFIMGYWGYDSNKEYVSWYPSINYSSGGRASCMFTIPSGISYISPHIVHNSNDFACTAKEEKLELGSHATDWCPNPEDKVNVADMRKPANDVAGIEEVNAKQDKIAYTPADDSKVVHTADASNWQKQAMFNPGSYAMDGTSSNIDFATLLRSKYNKPGVVYIRDGSFPVIDAVVICEGSGWWYAYGVAWNGTLDSNFVHRRIRESDDTGWVINADDSKVAHLSGANNFDTVPTVDNNPLLLASSLPPDLARTGQANTFTAAQTFSIAPTITDASQDKGDNQAATMADLKSVKKSAWRIGTLPNSQGLKNITMMYKIHDDHKYIEANIYGKSITGGPKGPIMLDFSRMVNRITNIDLVFVSSASGFSEGWSRGTSPAEFAGAEISLESHFSIGDYSTNIGIISLNGGSFAKIYYDSLVNN